MKVFHPNIRDKDQRLINSKRVAANILVNHLVIFEDFPKEGHRYLDFYLTFDINSNVRSKVIECLKIRYSGYDINAIAAIGNGGFSIGSCLAYVLNLPLIPIRKASDTVFNAYSTKVGMVYAQREITISKSIDLKGKRIVLIDDTIATGGTILGGIRLLEESGGDIVEVATVFETTKKGGRQFISPIPLFSIIAKDEF